MATDKTIIGLDIGSSKVRCVVGTIDKESQELIIEGVSEFSSEGVRNGVIVNIDQAVKVISNAIREVELQSGCEVDSVLLGVGGEHIKYIPSFGMSSVSDPNVGITREDIRQNLDMAKNIQIPENTQIIHQLVQNFEVDSRRGLKDPEGMTAHRFRSNVLLIVGSSTFLQDHMKCVQKAGVRVERLIYQPIADSDIVLSQEEKDMGVIVINIGAGMTSSVAFHDGYVVYVGGIDVGGDNVTSDISYIFQIPKGSAESLKISDGSCYSPSIAPDEEVITSVIGEQRQQGSRLLKKDLALVIEARMAEIFATIQLDIEEKGVSGPFASGVVLVGGGAMLSGITELAAEIFHLPVRLGFPEAIRGLDRSYIDPRYTTPVGLVRNEYYRIKMGKNSQANDSKKRFGSKFKSILGKFF